MKPRTATAIVLIAGMVWFVSSRAGAQAPAPGAPAVPAADQVTGRANQMIGWAQGAVTAAVHAATWAAGRPWLVVMVAVAVAVVVAIRFAVTHRPVPQDPQRMYTPEQRKQSFAWAGGQCEYTGMLLRRCRRPAEHADHLYPWSRGGATSLRNLAASCAPHNLSKGAKILPAWRVRLLVRRRRRYYPAGVPTGCGQMYADRFASTSV